MSSRLANEAEAVAPLHSASLDGVFNALAHPARRQILVSLYARGGSMSAGEIADRFKHSWPTTTRHLGVLEQAGMVSTFKRGRHRMYQLRRRLLLRAADWIYSWAEPVDDTVVSDERPTWTDLPFADMRNATAPDDPQGTNPN